MTQTHTSPDGFTITELLLVMVVTAIIVTLAVSLPISFLKTARDSERADDVNSIARRLEQAYIAQDLGWPAYPSTQELSADIAGSSRTLSRLSIEAFKSPQTTSSSVVLATSTSLTSPIATGGPTKNQYIYQPFTATDTLCNSASSSAAADRCVRFNFYYLLEADNSIRVVKSTHQQ